MASSFTLALLACLTVASGQNVLNPIVVAGNMLFDSVTKDRFYIKGVRWAHLVRLPPNPARTGCERKKDGRGVDVLAMSGPASNSCAGHVRLRDRRCKRAVLVGRARQLCFDGGVTRDPEPTLVGGRAVGTFPSIGCR